MARLMIRCPSTGAPVPTGLEMTPLEFSRSPLTGQAVDDCPQCHESHRWQKDQAYLEGERSVEPTQRDELQVPDELIARIFTLADYAVSPPDGKLYISGGGIDNTTVTELPGVLPPLWLALRLRIPWHMTSGPFRISIRVLDGDRNPVGPDPLLDGQLETGRPPGLHPGDEIGANVVLGLTGYPVQREGLIYFHLWVDDRLLGSLPLRVKRAVLLQPANR